MQLILTPITVDRNAMDKYLNHPFCAEVFDVYVNFYPKIGFHPPWIGYFFLKNERVVGVGGYKGPPQNNTIEIGYGVVPGNEGQGIATEICRLLVQTAINTDPQVKITARTLTEENASTSILRKNGFLFTGEVSDPEDGLVWEWHWSGTLV